MMKLSNSPVKIHQETKNILQLYPIPIYKKIIHNNWGKNSNSSSSSRIMFNMDNVVRPRKNNATWASRKIYNTPIFQIGELNSGYKETTPETIFTSDRKKKKKSIPKTVLHQLENYCDKTTLHGLRYVGDTSLSFGERIFWLFAFFFAVGFAAYYITLIYKKWNMNPVIIGFSPFDISLDSIPFPAITICNMNQAKKNEAEKILQGDYNNVERSLLDDYCNTNNSVDYSNITPDWETIRSFMLKVSQPCSEMLRFCEWKNDKVNCDDYFNNDLTDEGLCCSFNRLPPANIFRNPRDVPILNQTYASNVYDWTPEKGFTDKFTGDNSHIPLRSFGAGTHLGLTIVLDTDVDNYFCSSTNSVGFKVILSNPIETPKMSDFGFLITPGFEFRFAINPSVIESTDALRAMSIDTRQCYFSNERKLRYYRTYTNRNCKLECQSNYTLAMCKCIPYFLPKTRTDKVCGKKEQDCTDQAKEDMELTNGNGTSCHCLPGCFEMSFEKHGSFSKITEAINIKHDIGNYTTSYFVNNMAIAHFFFEEAKFRKQIKSELYGFTEILANVGGLLGLCLGFSLLSCIELIYFSTLKLFCSAMRSHQNRKKNNINSTINIYPFTK